MDKYKVKEKLEEVFPIMLQSYIIDSMEYFNDLSGDELLNEIEYLSFIKYLKNKVITSVKIFIEVDE